jgi:hypothetical protein
VALDKIEHCNPPRGGAEKFVGFSIYRSKINIARIAYFSTACILGKIHVRETSFTTVHFSNLFAIAPGIAVRPNLRKLDLFALGEDA